MRLTLYIKYNCREIKFRQYIQNDKYENYHINA